MLGHIIGDKYRLVSLLGKGGMGAVYKAVHVNTQTPVALKVIHPGKAEMSPDVVTRFEREAKATGRIQSAHIVQVFDTGRDPTTGLSYMVMELLGGEDLGSLSRKLGVLSPEVALRIVGQACLGLAKAHDAGIVHRDIKPANLFLVDTDSGDRIVKVLDFGIAKIKMEEAFSVEPQAVLTETGHMLGSPHYMSPEQAMGARSIDHRADIWSLGVVLYKLLSGRTPFDEAESLGQVIIAVCSKKPPSIRAYAPWIPREVADVLSRALSPVETRYPTARAMLEDIQAIVGDSWTIHEKSVAPLTESERAKLLELTAHEPGTMDSTETMFGSQADATSRGVGATTSPRTLKKRRVATALSVLVVGLVVLGVAAFPGARVRTSVTQLPIHAVQPASTSVSGPSDTAEQNLSHANPVAVAAKQPPAAEVSQVDGGSAAELSHVPELPLPEQVPTVKPSELAPSKATHEDRFRKGTPKPAPSTTHSAGRLQPTTNFE